MKTTLADRVAIDDKSIRSIIDVDIADLYTKALRAIRLLSTQAIALDL